MDLEELRKLALSSKKKKEDVEQVSFEFKEEENDFSDEMSDEDDFKFILNQKEEQEEKEEIQNKEENDFDLILTKHLNSKKKKFETVN
jgi:hypothetical protein